jgi:putative endonuclease
VFYTYLLASKRHGTLYCGHTDDLSVRVQQHRDKTFTGFTAKYDVTVLVWYEEHPSRDEAFLAERRIKKWNRAWKISLIEQDNPQWADLYPAFLAGGLDPWSREDERDLWVEWSAPVRRDGAGSE